MLPTTETVRYRGGRAQTQPWILHVRALGKTWRIAGERSDLDPHATDGAILVGAAAIVGLAPESFQGHAVDRGEGVIVVRQWAVWG